MTVAHLDVNLLCFLLSFLLDEFSHMVDLEYLEVL